MAQGTCTTAQVLLDEATWGIGDWGLVICFSSLGLGFRVFVLEDQR